MSYDPEKLYGFLEQTKKLYGNTIYLENFTKEKPEVNSDVLSAYYNDICNCQLCELGETRNKFVFGVGNPDADIIFVGEAPDDKEDLAGVPFVGREGKLLDKILAAINLTRDDIYICNVLKCSPPNNRDPLPSEVEKCEPYLKQQLTLIQPKLIVTLGRIAACTILKTKEPLKDLRNKVFSYEGIDLIVTYHPAALLRNPNFKRPAWEDFQMIRDKYLLKN